MLPILKAKPPSTEPLRVTLARKEPNFDAKLAALKAFGQTIFVKFGDVAEPKFRESMARSLARKFDARQLTEIQAFLATPTGEHFIAAWRAVYPDERQRMREDHDVQQHAAQVGVNLRDQP